eukprot:2606350-Pleurochrysis_carterae.AAC.2
MHFCKHIARHGFKHAAGYRLLYMHIAVAGMNVSYDVARTIRRRLAHIKDAPRKDRPREAAQLQAAVAHGLFKSAKLPYFLTSGESRLKPAVWYVTARVAASSLCSLRIFHCSSLYSCIPVS